MQKPVNLCDELACTRDWTVIVKQYGQPTMSPMSLTETDMKLCDPCAEKYAQRNALPARA